MSLKKRLAVSALSLSAAGLIGLTQWEGFSEEAYIPVAGDVPTIGFGSTEGVRMGDTITVPKAIGRLYRDTEKAESAIGRCVKVPLAQHEYDAFTSFAFNVGAEAFCSSTLVKKLNAGDYDGACKEILRWNKQKRIDSNWRVYYVELRGLTNRRKSEYEICKGR